MEYLGGSAPAEYDFAVYRGPSVPDASALQPASGPPRRGQQIAFSGFPHGIEDLLVQAATVAGPFESKGFYIDGSINGGNSGGPIVDPESRQVIGVVTQRRLLGGQPLEAMARQAQELADHCGQLRQGGGGVSIMGIDFAGFADMLAQSNLLLRNLMMANANAVWASGSTSLTPPTGAGSGV